MQRSSYLNTVGVVLDDLAQPPRYNSKSHIAFLKALIKQIEKRAIPLTLSSMLTEFPSQFEQVIQISRRADILKNPQIIKQNCSRHSMMKTVISACVKK